MLINELEQIVAAVLNLDQIDRNTDFSEYGMDSIIVTQLAVVITNQTGINLSPMTIYDNPTINRLHEAITR